MCWAVRDVLLLLLDRYTELRPEAKLHTSTVWAAATMFMSVSVRNHSMFMVPSNKEAAVKGFRDAKRESSVFLRPPLLLCKLQKKKEKKDGRWRVTHSSPASPPLLPRLLESPHISEAWGKREHYTNDIEKGCRGLGRGCWLNSAERFAERGRAGQLKRLTQCRALWQLLMCH